MTRIKWHRTELRELARRAWQRLRGGELTPLRAGASVAVGLAIGVLPLWGVHWLVVLAVCLPLRLDAGVAYLAANISLPILAPLLTFAELEVGARVLRGAWLSLRPSDVRGMDLSRVARELACGAVLVAVGAALVGGGVTYLLVALRVRLRRHPEMAGRPAGRTTK